MIEEYCTWDCKWHGMWHSHPPRPKSKPIHVSTPAIRCHFKLPPTPTVQDSINYHLECIKNYSKIINGAQWPVSLQEFCKPIVEEHKFNLTILQLAI